MGRAAWIAFGGFALAAADQSAKALIQSRFALGEGRVLVAGFFDLRYVQNTGAAWGLFAGLNVWLVLFSLAMLIGMWRWRRAWLTHTALDPVIAVCLLGGIVGNLIDRIRLGYVVDYLDFYWRDRHFPAFNIADAAICTGVGLYLIAQTLAARRVAAASSNPERPDGGATVSRG